MKVLRFRTEIKLPVELTTVQRIHEVEPFVRYVNELPGFVSKSVYCHGSQTCVDVYALPAAREIMMKALWPLFKNYKDLSVTELESPIVKASTSEVSV